MTGFDLKFWNKSLINSATTIPRFQQVVSRFTKLAMPTMCIISGHCFAGGLFLALAHDIRIMTMNDKIVSMSEINVGLLMAPWYVEFLKRMTLPQAGRTLMLGKHLTVKEAVEMEIITGVFRDVEDAEK